jgi:glycosyltransferase involved in cell wall biosynthesis
LLLTLSDTPPDSPGETRQALLCISQSFPPDTTPTGIRAGKLVQRLAERWDVTVVSEASGARGGEHVEVEVVPSRRPVRLLAALRRYRLGKLIELLVWPDESIFWLLGAIRAGRRAVKRRRPSAVVVFMMPYSAGLAGIVVAKLSRLPLVLNLDDSLTCTDMHPHFPTRLHYRLARALEDLYVRSADAVIYVSQTNLDAVRSRQREGAREKLHLVRYGADEQQATNAVQRGEDFEIAYVGAMSGWWALIDQSAPAGLASRLYGAWTRFGRYQRTLLDDSTSSPAIVGQAILGAVAEHPEWEGRVKLSIYGNPYPPDVVARALAGAGVQSVVSVHGPFPHEQVADILARADLLLVALPARTDGTRGGRISAKTYEYLMTDRPILAAVSAGENWDYLEGKPGVWLVEPHDVQAMQAAIVELARAKFDGRGVAAEREHLRDELSYDTRAKEFAAVVDTAVSRVRRRAGRR